MGDADAAWTVRRMATRRADAPHERARAGADNSFEALAALTAARRALSQACEAVARCQGMSVEHGAVDIRHAHVNGRARRLRDTWSKTMTYRLDFLRAGRSRSASLPPCWRLQDEAHMQVPTPEVR